MVSLMSMPVHRAQNRLDFSPVDDAITDYRQSMDRDHVTQQNRLLGDMRKTQGARAAADLADEQGRLELGESYRASADRDDDRKTALRTKRDQMLAGMAQSVLEAPEEHRAALWGKIRALDPESDKALQAAGIDPNDYDTAARVIVGRVRGWQDPLERQKLEAQIEQARASAAQSRAHADYYAKGGPAQRGPTGYAWDEEEQRYKYIPGGPADPEVLERNAQARGNKNRTLSPNDIGKLEDAGATYQSVVGFGSTFKPEFGSFGAWGGYGADQVLAAARTGVPGFGDYQDAAKWWQDYDRHKNVVRNDQFGAALTPGEKEEFDKADIKPGMDPSIIQANLARQEVIRASALRRRMKAMAAAGYQQQPIEEAYGITLDELNAGLVGWDEEQAQRKAEKEAMRAQQAQQPAMSRPAPSATRAPPRQAPSAPQGSFVHPDAAAELARDPSPEAMREFDEIFGAGAAQRVLGAR